MKLSRWMKLAGLGVLALALSGCALFNQPPTANFSWAPLEPLARTEITFSDFSTDSGGLFGGGGIVSWNWDFGDSDSSTSPSPKHEYDKSGTYTIRLTVTDDQGESATLQKQITVTPSLDGTWRGQIVNPGGWTDQLELVFSHSISGGIQGHGFYFATRVAVTGVSFSPVTKRVSFEMPDLGIRLEGTLDPSETRITGDWYVIGAPLQGFGWDVTLQ
jgi:PKD repeat protein